MRVLESFPHFRIEHSSADSQVARRSEKVQHPGPLRSNARPAGVHDVGVFNASLVASLTDEGHFEPWAGPWPGYFFPLALALALALGLAAGFALAGGFALLGAALFAGVGGFGGAGLAGAFGATAAPASR